MLARENTMVTSLVGVESVLILAVDGVLLLLCSLRYLKRRS